MIFDTIVKGIIIGLSISVPLGPIGMLCIQRTLNRGQKYGLVTGLGATSSDLIYSIITIFFLSNVLDFVEEKKVILQLVGSIIIVLFGIWIYRSHPSAQPLPHEKQNEHSIVSDYFTSLALTLTNPLILFVLIALFAQFDFIRTEMTFWEYAFSLSTILLGAALWWLILTTFASRFRHKFSFRGLKLINQITGSIIMIIGIIGVILSLIH